MLDGEGGLIGLADIQMPTKVHTAAAAECATLAVTVMLFPALPQIVTDCLSLVATARRGFPAATAAGRVLAGFWNMICGAVDGDSERLCRALAWMPAHKSLAKALRAVKSNGEPVTRAQWRATRLADAAAKGIARETIRALSLIHI